MIYPNNFEHKIGFSEVRTLLKGRCMSTLGTEWVDNQVKFSNKFELVKESLEQAREFALFRMTEEEVYEENFYDVRQPLLRIRPERTYLEELDLFDLKRSLQTVVSLVQFSDLVEKGQMQSPKMERARRRMPRCRPKWFILLWHA